MSHNNVTKVVWYIFPDEFLNLYGFRCQCSGVSLLVQGSTFKGSEVKRHREEEAHQNTATSKP